MERRPIGPQQQAGTQGTAKAADPMPPPDDKNKPADPPPADSAAPSPDTVDPVDTASADYKAGYQAGADGVDTGSANFKAGYAAGMGSGGGSADEGTPAEPPPDGAAAGKPATAKDLRAAFGDDPEAKAFCMDQLFAGATVAEAHVARNKQLSGRVADLEKKLAGATGGQAPIGTAAASEPAARAGEPAADADPKARAAWEWDHKPEVRAGFSGKERYVNYRAAELAGRVRTLNRNK